PTQRTGSFSARIAGSSTGRGPAATREAVSVSSIHGATAMTRVPPGLPLTPSRRNLVLLPLPQPLRFLSPAPWPSSWLSRQASFSIVGDTVALIRGRSLRMDPVDRLSADPIQERKDEA